MENLLNRLEETTTTLSSSSSELLLDFKNSCQKEEAKKPNNDPMIKYGIYEANNENSLEMLLGIDMVKRNDERKKCYHGNEQKY